MSVRAETRFDVKVDLDGEAPQSIPFIRKVGWSILTGLVAFAGSALLDNVLQVSLADQLVLTFITGGVTLLVQYLSDFEERLRESQRYQRTLLDELHNAIQRGFVGVSAATTLMEDIERSALRKESLTNFIRRAGDLAPTAKPLLRALAATEIERVSRTLQSLAEGNEISYDGEDREFLLALTQEATKSILATSWATVAVNEAGFEARFWLTDLGGRYLNLQRSAVRRGVTIKRIFVLESRELIGFDGLKHVIAMQRGAGIDVRLLHRGPPQHDEAIADGALFDETVWYDTTPTPQVGTPCPPWMLNTRIMFDGQKVRQRLLQFGELWDAATVSLSEV
jgi:hypothetical protein